MAKEKYSAAMDIWKVWEIDWKAWNVVLKDGWDEDVKKWNVEWDNTKYDRRKLRWTKPKMPMMEKIICKPRLADFNTEDMSSGEEEDGDMQSIGDGDVHSDYNHPNQEITAWCDLGQWPSFSW